MVRIDLRAVYAPARIEVTMPNVTVPGNISADFAEDVLERELGTRFRVEPRKNSPDQLKVRHSPLASATVRVERQGSDTMFHVHGGGLGRVVNEFGIARDVAGALEKGLTQ